MGLSYISGSAVDIRCEIDQEDVEDTIITLESLIDPDGNEILSGQSMEYDTVETNVAKMIWQSTDGVDPLGRYEYIVKALNGVNANYAKGFFHLEGR